MSEETAAPAVAAESEVMQTITPETSPRAEEPAETPAPEAAPEAPPAAAHDLAIARRFEAARQSEMKARKATLASQQRMKDIEDREAKLAAREQALKEEEALLADDPLAWTDRRKVDPDNLAKRYLQPKTPLERELEAIKAKLSEKDKKEAEAAEAAAKQAEAAQQSGRMRSFVSEITPDECPNLTRLYKAHHVPFLVREALEEHGDAFQEEHGRLPTNAELRAYLEHQASERAQEILKGQRAPESAPGEAGSGQLENGSGHQAKNGPHTLTNNHAAQTASGSARPKTREERKAALIAQLEAEERAARVH